MKIKFEHGEVFFTDAVTIIHGPNKFIFDFKQGSPRVDYVGGEEHQTVVVKHNTIMMDVAFAKKFLETLKENIKNYEKRFGKVKINEKENEVIENKPLSNPYIS